MRMTCTRHGTLDGVYLYEFNVTVCPICADCKYYAEPILIAYADAVEPKENVIYLNRIAQYAKR